MPLLIAVSGFKDSGKTSLARTIIKELAARGLLLAFLKHTDRSVLSPSGTDTGSVEESGAPSVYWGRDGLRIEIPNAVFDTDSIRALFPEKDLVIVEGGKNLPMPRVWTGSPGSVPEDVKGIFACFDRTVPCGDGSFLFAPGEEIDLADKILQMHARYARVSSVEVSVQGRRIPLKPFVAGMIRGSIAGLLLPLKGVGSLREGVNIRLKRVE